MDKFVKIGLMTISTVLIFYAVCTYVFGIVVTTLEILAFLFMGIAVGAGVISSVDKKK